MLAYMNKKNTPLSKIGRGYKLNQLFRHQLYFYKVKYIRFKVVLSCDFIVDFHQTTRQQQDNTLDNHR